MGDGPRYRIKLKRRIKGLTDYRNRLNLLKSGKPRAVVRISNNNIYLQFVEFNPEGDEIIESVDSRHLREYGWEGHGKNLPSAYLVGFLGGKKAMKNGIDEAVLDIGLNLAEPGGRIFTVLKGILDAGMHIPHGEEILPDENRVRGEHIGEEVTKNFEKVKAKLEEL